MADEWWRCPNCGHLYPSPIHLEIPPLHTCSKGGKTRSWVMVREDDTRDHN